MGTWDAGSFGNDSAVDWTYGLEKQTGLTYIEAALDRVLSSGENVEAEAGEHAIAAAEVLARLKGKSGLKDAYSETADTWVRSNQQAVPSALLLKAAQALHRVTARQSELYELWEESGDIETWIGIVNDLRLRLSAT
jgi:hypothetical protein